MFASTLRENQNGKSIPINLFEAIEDLKQELNAVILAHYYQESDIQDIADYIGDSLGLSQKAASTNEDIRVAALRQIQRMLELSAS